MIPAPGRSTVHSSAIGCGPGTIPAISGSSPAPTSGRGEFFRSCRRRSFSRFFSSRARSRSRFLKVWLPAMTNPFERRARTPPPCGLAPGAGRPREDWSVAHRGAGGYFLPAITAAAVIPAATAAIAAPAAPAIAASATATPAEPAASSAATALGPLLGLVHAERAAVEDGTVHLLDRLGGRFRRRHLDEGKAARPPGLALGHQPSLDDLTELLKGRHQSLFRGVEGEVPHEQSIPHAFSCGPRRDVRFHLPCIEAASKQDARRALYWIYH